MSKAIIMVGVIGSGKSTKAEEIASKEPETIILNKDAIRTMFKGVYVFDENLEPLVKQVAGHIIFEALYSGRNIIIDETNISKAKRIAQIKYLRDKFPTIEINAIVFKPNILYLKRRLKEPRGYTTQKWTQIYEQMCASFELPDNSEGFDSITVMPDPDPNEDVVTPLLSQRSFCRENGLPYFIPSEICPGCKRNLNNSTFMMENAGSMHISYCPHCHYSFNN